MANDDENGGKTTIARLKTRPLERNLALARLGMGAGAKIALHSLSNIFRGEISRTSADRRFYAEQAQVLADELGQLKGSVMKAGQMLSLYAQYFLPEEAVAVLATLQDSSMPVAWSGVAPQLELALGARTLRELDIDHTPIAAASLGQAHRARRRSDGLELVVKIQYPGVASAIDSDLKTLSRLIVASRLTPKNFDLTPIFAEVREMLLRECDYGQERVWTEDFARRLADDPRYQVPRVLPEYSAGTVLTTTFESGCSVQDARVRALPQARRDALGQAFAEIFLREFFEWRMVQTDPHFGNYRVRLDEAGQDRLVLLDFGATRAYTAEFVRDYALIVRGALSGDAPTVGLGATAIGLIGADFPASALQAFAAMCAQIVEPFVPERAPPAQLNARGAYRFGGSDLPMRISQMAAKNALSLSFQVPPREIVFLHRRLAGVFIALATLGAEIDLRKPLARTLSAIALQQS
ncbi:AarF/ABC1/UbiB kinase family protein [Phenylobacterium sp.]|uniref:ABC1 kinase family protein n=1 Tax=Phenylobacterium sp. TaxID=1871053 RepID=UPI002737AFB3|nr:AarF/ABC1/UbiB kinase family protein [Phenylobacterium sp.]MDP3870857.1 AarF/ABC1/UbiB kinase family protein [Phenylobacterium sp.]